MAMIPNFTLGPEEVVADAFMERPSIATDSKCQPHIVCDAGGNTRFMKYHRLNGAWSGGVFATGSRGGKYDASRLYVGQIEIDAMDRAWISCKFGVKEFGSMYGQGLWLFKNVATQPKQKWFRFVCVYKGMGLVSLNPAEPSEAVVLGTYGNFKVINFKGQETDKGSINNGSGGEKVRFRISPGGTWHTVMNGWSKMSSSYQNDKRWEETQGGAPLTWSDYKKWPQQGSDFCHPGIGIDLVNPDICYMASVFGSTLVYNVYDGKRLIYGSQGVDCAGWFACVSETRHGPAFAPAPGGGTFMFAARPDAGVSAGFINPAGQLEEGWFGAFTNDSTSRSPAACTDREGNIHLVYKVESRIFYRKITVSG
jgi:hypothetical protein